LKFLFGPPLQYSISVLIMAKHRRREARSLANVNVRNDMKLEIFE